VTAPLTVAALAAVVAGAPVAAAARARAVAVPAVGAPLATSITVAGTTWVSLPMGDLGQVDNTFWQLFVRRAGGSRFALATPPGVADNGGLVSASAGGGSLVAGFETSQLLGFSPLASTTDAGRVWSPSTLAEPLAAEPDALASTGGRTFALVGRRATSIVAGRTGGSTWSPVVSLRALAATAAGAACGLTDLTAIATAANGALLVAGSCRTAGRIGVFVRDPDGWLAVGRPLPRPSGTITVLEMDDVAGRLHLLLTTSSGRSRSIVEATERGPGSTPLLSSRLVLGRDDRLTAAAFSALGAVGLVVADGSAERLLELDGASARWAAHPVPAAGAAIPVFSPNGAVGLLVGGRTVMRDFVLVGQHRWRLVQQVSVPIEFGSSS
jgi:hypothetical protein